MPSKVAKRDKWFSLENMSNMKTGMLCNHCIKYGLYLKFLYKYIQKSMIIMNIIVFAPGWPFAGNVHL